MTGERDKEGNEEEKGPGSNIVQCVSPAIHCPVSACWGKLSTSVLLKLDFACGSHGNMICSCTGGTLSNMVTQADLST